MTAAMNAVRQHPVQAFLLALAAVALLSVMDAVMKALVIAIGLYATSLWRALTGVIAGTLLYLPTRKAWPTGRVIRLHVLRATVTTVMALTFFYGLARTPMAQAIALTFIAPLIAQGLAAATLGEEVGRRTIIASVAAFAGVAVIVGGSILGGPAASSGTMWGTVAILVSALTYAVNIVLMRRQSVAAGPLEIAFFQNLTVTALLLAALPVLGIPAWPTGYELRVAAAAAMSFGGILLFASAYARGPASLLAISEYSGLLWAAALGWLMFAEPIAQATIIGAVLIVGGCIYATGGRREPGEIEALA